MEPCSADKWDVEIFAGDVSPALIARPLFRNVRVTGGILRGEVQDAQGNPISDLIGTCVPIPDLNIPELSQMTFFFRLKDLGSEIGIFLIGYAFPRSGSSLPIFNGRWLAHPPGPNTPAATGDGSRIFLPGFVLPGSGDTGTSTGTGGGPQITAV